MQRYLSTLSALRAALGPVIVAFVAVASLPVSLHAGGHFFTVREADDVLVRIDSETLAFTDIGPLGVAFRFGGLAYDTFNETLYMISGRGTQSLYTVDVETGAATLIGAHRVTDLFGLAYDSRNRVLYATGESPAGLYSLDVTTGSASLIGTPPGPLDGLAIDLEQIAGTSGVADKPIVR